MSRHKNHAVLVSAGLLTLSGAVLADGPAISTHGGPGLVEAPTAETLKDGELVFSVSAFGPIQRTSATFQFLPKVYGIFRYTIFEDFLPSDVDVFDGNRYDRNFDIHFAVLDEERYGFDLGVGLRDFIGTSDSSSEYIVATKEVAEGIRLTGGLAWGRLGQEAGLQNPIAALDDSFNDREGFFGEEERRDTGGQLNSADWFRGDVGFFGGASWVVSESLSFHVEYVDNSYEREGENSGLTVSSPINAAVDYQFENGVGVRAFTIGGNNFGGQLSVSLSPKERLVAGGAEPAPRPVEPRDSLVAASWNGFGDNDVQEVLSQRLAAEGLLLDSFVLDGRQAELRIQNVRYDIEAQAAGRASRVLANTLPPEIESFEVVFQQNGLPLSSVMTQRSDLELLQYDYDNAWRLQSRSEISDPVGPADAPARFNYSLSPYLALSFFEPESPVRADIGPQLNVSYQAAPGLTFSGQFRYPLVGNLGDSTRESDSILPRVRSESYLFASESDFEINQLTAEYLFRPGENIFGRITGGYLESQFGGVSTEVLYRPIDGRFAYGVELNYAVQRDFDMLLGFQDYDILTGHASAYMDLSNGFAAQVDAGRYLAGDWGATFALAREFNNGVRIGGYFTITDVPFDDFGEGSFDKGISVEFPLSWFTGSPSRQSISQTIQPVLRDGGARIKVDNRLYDLTSEYGGPSLSDGWARYLR